MDHRILAKTVGNWYERLDPKRMIAVATLYMSDPRDGEYEEEREIPVKWELCPTCEGKGSHVNPSIDSHGISPEEFAEDPDFEIEYRRGFYDVPCYECGGRRVVPVPFSKQDREDVDRTMRERRAVEIECARAASLGY